MSFLALIVRNLWRRPVRTSLAALGISVGIATVIALGVIADGLIKSAGEVLKPRDSDFIVAQKGTADLTFSVVAESDWETVATRDDVDYAIGSLLHIVRIGANPFFPLVGVRSEQLSASAPRMVAGRAIQPGAVDEVMIGDAAAKDQKLWLGDTLTVDATTFRVVGVYDSGNLFEDHGAYAPLASVQRIARRPGTITLVYVKVKEGADAKAVAQSIRMTIPSVTTVSNIAEYGEVDQGTKIINAADLAISLLAIFIGAIGVMNTMVMSVSERTREIGILRAVGWRGRRIIRMIIGESLLLCLAGTAAGAVLGWLGSRATLLIPSIGAFLEPSYTMEVFIRAVVVAVIVALVGAAYPAYRAVRLMPLEALRYE